MPLSFSNILPPKPSSNNIGAAMAQQSNQQFGPLSFSPLAMQNQGKAAKTTIAPVKPAATASPVTPVSPGSQSTGISADQVRSNLAAFNAKQPQAPASTGSSYSGTSPNLVGTIPPAANKPASTTDQPVVAGSNSTQPAVGGLFGQLLGKSNSAYDQAGQVGQEAGQLRQAIARETQDVMGNPYYSGSVKVGDANIIQQNQGSQLQALVDQQKALQTQAAGYTANAGNIPDALRYGVDNGTGTGTGTDTTGGSNGGMNLAPQSQATNYAQDVVTGKRSYDDAVSAMGLYGAAGKQFLDAAIKQANPNYNFAQGQTLGANQGAVGPAYQFAQTALDNVTQAMSKLSSVQTTNIPGVNAISNFLSTETGAGSEATRAVTGAVQTLRNAYAALLAANRGGTPTDYSAQATAEIPDKPTPNDIAAIKANFQALGGARASIYGNPGSAQGSSGGSNSGAFNEGQTSSDGSLVFKGGQWVVNK